MNLTSSQVDEASVLACIKARRSVRSFSSKEVSHELIAEILKIASHSPSGTNTQPWRVYVATGQTLKNVVSQVCATYDENPNYRESSVADVYCNLDQEPYLSRKRTLGRALYGLLGIQKGDTEKMIYQQRRNFEFFDAPVGLFVTIDKSLGYGSWLDTGMFMQTLMLAAKAKGLDTCAQGFWVQYESIIAPIMGWGGNERLVSGMSLGFVQPNALINSFCSAREPISKFVTFKG